MAAQDIPPSSGIGNQAGPQTSEVTPKDIYDELIAAGASTDQALGIMGNMIHESGLNVETGAGGKTIDNNGAPVYGLVSWNAASYPDAGSLVTGNPQKDLKAQVNYLAQTGGFGDATGNSPAESASNFAAKYERCQGCEAGGNQNQQRQASANTVAGWLTQGNWPASAGNAAQVAQASSGASVSGKESCLWFLASLDPLSSLPLIGRFAPNTSVCIISKPQARAVMGALLMAAGFVTMGGAVVILAVAAAPPKLKSAATTAAGAIPGVGTVVTAAKVAAPSRIQARAPSRARAAAPPPPPPPSPSPAPSGTVADRRGTSPEFRRKYLGES